MSLAYRFLYRVGFAPWEQMAKLPVADQIGALFAREEEGREPPYGEVLDLGCGSGIWAVKLAERGWRVTGMDFVPRALRQARERAHQAGVEVRLVDGDVTKLGEAGVGSGFAFLLDFGLFHDELTDEQRKAMGREVTAVAAAYPAWKVIDEEAVDTSLGPRTWRGASSPFYRIWRSANPRFFRLRRE
jgi:SAM-dependent methyltransferase